MWSRPPAAPMRSVSDFSTAMWMSSSLMSNANVPAAMSSPTASRPARMASASSGEMTPTLASILACALEPAMSSAHMRLSNGSDAP